MLGIDSLCLDFAEVESLGLEDEFLTLHAELVQQVEYFIVYVLGDLIMPCLRHELSRENAGEYSIHLDVLSDGFAEDDEREVDLVPDSPHEYVVLEQFELDAHLALVSDVALGEVLAAVARGVALGARGVEDGDAGIEHGSLGVEDVVEDVGELLWHFGGLPGVFLESVNDLIFESVLNVSGVTLWKTLM